MTSLRYILIVLLSGIVLFSDAQKRIPLSEGYVVEVKIINGDTPQSAQGSSKRQTNLQKQKKARRYTRLVRNVKKVYPYSKIAGQLLRKYSDTLATIDNKKQRKKLMRRCEKELWNQFGDELKKLTMTQGMILLKLIDRETGATGYALVKDLRGGFTAFFFQSIARLFHLNLKSTFDGAGEDQMIEDIVLLIERGEI